MPVHFGVGVSAWGQRGYLDGLPLVSAVRGNLSIMAFDGADLLSHLLMDRNTGAALPGDISAVGLGDLAAVLLGDLVAAFLGDLGGSSAWVRFGRFLWEPSGSSAWGPGDRFH